MLSISLPHRRRLSRPQACRHARPRTSSGSSTRRSGRQPQGWHRFRAAVAVGFIGAGIFVPDPLNGYPPGTPNLPVARSNSGVLHDLFSMGFFGGLPAARFVLGRRFVAWGDRAWASYSIGTGRAFLIAFVLTSAGFGQVDGLAEVAGLLQRITVVIGLTWMGLLSVHLLRNRTRGRRAVPRGLGDLAA